MHIDVLHIPDCPNLDRARARLRTALDQAAMTASMREIEITGAAAAARAGMHGSPTILIDGEDPFVSAWTEASLSCRLFRTADGLDGAPTVSQLVEVLSR